MEDECDEASPAAPPADVKQPPPPETAKPKAAQNKTPQEILEQLLAAFNEAVGRAFGKKAEAVAPGDYEEDPIASALEPALDRVLALVQSIAQDGEDEAKRDLADMIADLTSGLDDKALARLRDPTVLCGVFPTLSDIEADLLADAVPRADDKGVPPPPWEGAHAAAHTVASEDPVATSASQPPAVPVV